MSQTSQAPSAAPEEGAGQAPSDRSTEFVAVQGGAETTSAGALLITAYVAMWALVFGFVWLSSRKQRALDTRIRDLEATLRRVEGGAATSFES